MNRFFGLIIVLLVASTSWGQDSLNTPRSFALGIKPSLRVASTGSNYYSSQVGFGLGLYGQRRIAKSPLFINSELQYTLLRYSIVDEDALLTHGHAGFLLGPSFKIKELGNSSLMLNYRIGGSRVISEFTGRDAFKVPDLDLTPSLTNALTHSLVFGFDINLNSRTSLELTYSLVLNKKKLNHVIDAQPNSLAIGFNIDFLKRKTKIPAANKVKETLGKLKNDTLYILDRLCSTDPTTSQLDSLLEWHFNFCEYKIISDDQINAVLKQPNVIHFALIGKHYASEGDPTTNGIYLLDKDLNNTKRPYPHYTYDVQNYAGTLDYCFSDINALRDVIISFNAKLSASAKN